MKFATTFSPYFEDYTQKEVSARPAGFNETAGTCDILAMATRNSEMSAENARPVHQEVGMMVKITFNARKNKVQKYSMYSPPQYIRDLFKNGLSGLRTDSFVCRTLRDSCSEVYKANGSPSMNECMRMLRRLPMLTKDYCVVHAVLAKSNPAYCPYISFSPLADNKGKIKCQSSSMIPIGDGLSTFDMAMFNSFLASHDIDPDVGYKMKCVDAKNWQPLVVPGIADVCSKVRASPLFACRFPGAEYVCAFTCSRMCNVISRMRWELHH